MTERVFSQDGLGRISRRSLLLSVPGLLAAGAVRGQSGKPMLKARDMNHLGLSVADLRRSVAFYQGLFGMPVQARQGGTVLLRIGTGPQYMALTEAGPNPTGIMHMGLGIDEFNADRIVGVLKAHGIAKAEGTNDGPATVRVRSRGADAGGAKEGTTEVILTDPDGIVVQLQDPRFCGGAGAFGEVCASVTPAPGKGLIAIKEINHFTVRVPDAVKSNAFYQGLFGWPIRSYQGPTAPTLAIGRVGFVMYSGRGAGTAGAIDHVCFNLDGFNVDQLTKTFESYGIKPRGKDPAGPMQWYVSMRMENRGGAKEGTPELYFTDPDGIPIQLQDSSYCGGGGVLGNACS